MKKTNQRTIKTGHSELKELSLLYKISSSMHTLDLNEILHLILEAVTKGIGFDRARLYIYDEEAQVLRFEMSVLGCPTTSANCGMLVHQWEFAKSSTAIRQANH